MLAGTNSSWPEAQQTTEEGEVFPVVCFGRHKDKACGGTVTNSPENKDRNVCVFTKSQYQPVTWSPLTWLGPEYVFPVISYRPHATQYLRTDEKKGKENEWEVNGQFDKRGPALRLREEKH